MPQRKLKVVQGCTWQCRRGNPLRYGYCTCQCNGKQHGSQKVTTSHLEHLTRQKLMDPEIGRGEAKMWNDLLDQCRDLGRQSHLRRVK